jgi:GT2 family glycosyltransferase
VVKPQQADAVTPRVSVIIASWNTRDLLAACLESLRSPLSAGLAEVIVVDNGSEDGSPAMVRERFPSAMLICPGRNLGFGGANNLGLRAARGRYIVLLNSDTEVPDGALESMCDFMDAHPRVGILGPKLLNPDGSVQLSCRRFPSYRTALFDRYSLLTRLFPRNPYSREYLMTDTGHSDTREVDWVSGACLMARREAIEEVGPLDEAFFMYAEDVDWCYRMHQKGWKVVYYPEARVLHHVGRSTRSAPFRMTVERHRSMWVFYKKHYSRGIVLVDAATLCGIALRCGFMVLRNLVRRLLRLEARS